MKTTYRVTLPDGTEATRTSVRAPAFATVISSDPEKSKAMMAEMMADPTWGGEDRETRIANWNAEIAKIELTPWAVAHWHGTLKAAEAKAGEIRRNPWNRTLAEVRVIPVEKV